MKKNIYQLMLMVLIPAVFFSCQKEAPLTPSTEKTGYVVPQGSNDYDAIIVNFYSTYGKYILYNFTDKDTYWTPNGWKNAYSSSTGMWNSGYQAAPADPLFLKKQLTFLQNQWFSLYPAKFLKDFLPVKIMLCTQVDSIWSAYSNGAFTKGVKAVAAWYNYDNICVNNGNASIDAMTPANITAYRTKLNMIFIQSIIGRNMITSIPLSYSNLTDYTVKQTSTTNAYKVGILYSYFKTPTAVLDWGLYMLAMVSCSETTLNRSTANTDATFSGILNVTKDANGVIRKKYNVVRQYYIDNYGLDLQAIGNLAN